MPDKKRARHVTHGLTGKRVYKTWESMKARCYHPHDGKYEKYGGSCLLYTSVLADRVRLHVPLFEVNIYATLCVSMIKTLWNIYIKQKTRNLTRIPIFAMAGGEI